MATNNASGKMNTGDMIVLQFDSTDFTSWEWIAQQEHNIAQVWHIYRRKVRAYVRDDPMQGQI